MILEIAQAHVVEREFVRGFQYHRRGEAGFGRFMNDGWIDGRGFARFVNTP